MFLHDPLANTFSLDRQARFRRAADRRKLVGRTRVPPADRPPAINRSIDWSSDADLVLRQPRATCVA
jgi:hypothetical protein